MALSPKQTHFVKEYLKDKNATRAAKAAGYSAKTANSCGPRLLVNAGIRKAIDKGLADLAEKTGISAQRVIEEISKIALQDLTKMEMKKISGNKLKALELLAKHFKLLTDKFEHTGANGEPLVKVSISLPANGRELIPESKEESEKDGD